MAKFQVVTDPGVVFYGRLLDQFAIFETEDDETQISRNLRPLDEAAVKLLQAKGVKTAKVEKPLSREKKKPPPGTKAIGGGLATFQAPGAGEDDEPGGFAARPRTLGSASAEALEEVRAKAAARRPNEKLG